MQKNNIKLFPSIKNQPDAAAVISGSAQYPLIKGNIYFLQRQKGVLVTAYIQGLPTFEESCQNPVFGFHIHSGSSCSGNESDPFADALTHYNPQGCTHPHHAGDMPPLFNNSGYAFLSFMTNRFKVREIIGKTVIIHSSPDDFTTQPAGNSGTKIACGEIKSLW